MSYKKPVRAALTLCILAAVFYNSWPLGYVLNNQSAHNGLASDLEKVGQPHYQLFILGDILTGISLIAVCILIRFKLWPILRSKTWVAVCLGLLLFEVFTTVAAILPSQCTVTPIVRCGAGGGHGLGLDAFLSSIAALGLLISLASLSAHGRRYKLSDKLTRITRIILIAWVVSGVWFVIPALTNGNAHLPQQILLIFSGLALLAIGLNINSAAGPGAAEN